MYNKHFKSKFLFLSCVSLLVRLVFHFVSLHYSPWHCVSCFLFIINQRQAAYCSSRPFWVKLWYRLPSAINYVWGKKKIDSRVVFSVSWLATTCRAVSFSLSFLSLVIFLEFSDTVFHGRSYFFLALSQKDVLSPNPAKNKESCIFQPGKQLSMRTTPGLFIFYATF